MEEEPVKYFSLPRPKYNPNPDSKIADPVELSKIKYRTNAENFRQRRFGGRRFTVDVTSTEVETALADIGKQKSLSRSVSSLNKPSHNEMKLNGLSNKKLTITEEDESEQPKGPEFIVNSVSETKTIDISDNKVRYSNWNDLHSRSH